MKKDDNNLLTSILVAAGTAALTELIKHLGTSASED